ncbi:peptidase family T4 [Bordetella bronchiseptica 00-P-2730]|nr:peptidase family T4 [Bordetella bronchiseptica 00-P-2730]
MISRRRPWPRRTNEQAWRSAASVFEQGSVGAGRGMSSFGLKGGVGSASRLAQAYPGQRYTVGALVLSNFGRRASMTIAGRPFGRRLAAASHDGEPAGQPEQGSIILVLATDAPLDSRQLRRLSLRAGAGLARTGECNDGYLNDIQAQAVAEAHYEQAWRGAASVFEQGSVGAGRGMSSFGFKGGIGSASRLAEAYPGQRYTVGALVLSNFGQRSSMTIAGRPFGRRLAAAAARDDEPAGQPEMGSIILLLATDAPLDSRQLRRLSLRAGAGLARTGSVFGHGSGDIALAFSTAYTIPHLAERGMPVQVMLHETRIDALFEAAAEAVEQAIVAALWRAETVAGRDGHVRRAIREAAPQWRQWLAETAF